MKVYSRGKFTEATPGHLAAVDMLRRVMLITHASNRLYRVMQHNTDAEVDALRHAQERGWLMYYPRTTLRGMHGWAETGAGVAMLDYLERGEER